MTFTKILFFGNLLGIFRVFASYQAPLVSTAVDSRTSPSISIAIGNAPHIFNSINGAMRQWGSSLKHNGMSFFPVTIPENTVFYHGSPFQPTVEGITWLAFEVEHAELFTGMVPQNLGGPNTYFNLNEVAGDKSENLTGYFSTYRITRPLKNVLYLDGLSSGKSTLGTMDTQDRVLLKDSGFKDRPGFDDLHRAQILCNLTSHIDGIIRMELGFEIILCDVNKVTEHISTTTRKAKWQHKRRREDYFWNGEFARGISLGYSGVGAGRVLLDYASMVSAYFYPLNLTNPIPERSLLPRIPQDNSEGVERLKNDVVAIFDGRERVQGNIDWQAITDSIVSRYSDRLAYIRSIKSDRMEVLYEIDFLVERFIDNKTQNLTEAHELCTSDYLLSVGQRPSGTTEVMIYEAITAVSRKICGVLMEARRELVESESPYVADKVKNMIGDLMKWLDWSRWLECGKCDWNEVCVVAIWPWGTKEDHDSPRCLNLYESWGRTGYWDFDYHIPGWPSEEKK